MRYRPGQIGECDHARREGIEDRMSAPPPPSQYGAPQYEAAQPHYGPPPGYPPPPARTSAYPVVNESHQGFGVVGGAFVVIGAVLLVLGFTVLNWFRSDYSTFGGGGTGSHFSGVHHRLDLAQRAFGQVPQFSKYIHLGIAPTYFSWLGWVLLVAAIVLGLAAVAPLGAASAPARILGVVVALAGIGLTLWALDLLRIDGPIAQRLAPDQNIPSYFDYIKHTSFGAWAALAGFLLIAIGALIGPGRTTGPARY